MIRRIAYLLLVASACAAVLAGLQLWEVSTAPLVATEPARQVPPPDPSSRSENPPPQRPFLAIFGTAPAPVAADPEAEPPRPMPDYGLKGVIASGEMRWAIITAPGGDVLVREGERLADGTEVVEIYAEGVELAFDGQPVQLRFSASAPVEVVAIEQGVGALDIPPMDYAPRDDVLPQPKAQEVIFQNLSREDLANYLAQAERLRRERGWVPASQ